MALLAALFLGAPALADETTPAFNRLAAVKARIESASGIRSLECFPFADAIGTAEDERRLVQQCLQGATALAEALADAPGNPVRTAGIGDRFARVNGFATVLVPWDATPRALAEFLRAVTPEAEQARFFEKIRALRNTLADKLVQTEVYCTQRIANEECVRGLESLALATAGAARRTAWREVIISERSHFTENPYGLILPADAAPEEMARALYESNPEAAWKAKKKMYEDIDAQHGEAINSKLRVVNFFCAPDLTPAECAGGAANLAAAADDPILRSQHWGRVYLNRRNTALRNDFDVDIRFDLDAAGIGKMFAGRSTRAEIEENTVRAEKIEEGLRNNFTGLRVACDPVNLRSELCTAALSSFTRFAQANRGYLAARPWSGLMFIDGDQLKRVNFALNSPMRDATIYLDARSDAEELRAQLQRISEKK